MKLEVGMYVRTDDGEIGKITHIETETFSEPAYTLDIFTQGTYKGCKWFEGKASRDILDLIEKNDFVNGKRVSCKIDKYIYLEDEIRVSSKQIKSIVTKEQFESISYEVSK